jgi:hypothetical protein
MLACGRGAGVSLEPVPRIRHVDHRSSEELARAHAGSRLVERCAPAIVED